MSNIAELRGITKIYQMDSVKVEALRGIDLSIKKGEIISIMGPSGSGKSTLLQILGLLERPTNGKVFLDGIDTSRLKEDILSEFRGKRIGFVFQFFNLYPTLNARENVELPLAILERKKEDRTKRAHELLKIVGLTGREDHMPSQLSGGERQRVAIARALATEPAIILADEPTGNLDTKTGGEVIDMLVKVNEQFGTTVILITHDLHIAQHADRIIQIRDGKIVSEQKKGRRGH
jgi:putative ABC transport system ATP-binding protein